MEPDSASAVSPAALSELSEDELSSLAGSWADLVLTTSASLSIEPYVTSADVVVRASLFSRTTREVVWEHVSSGEASGLLVNPVMGNLQGAPILRVLWETFDKVFATLEPIHNVR